MLYRTLKRVIENGIKNGNLNVADVTNKCDIFFAAGKLTETEYTELLSMLPAVE